MDPIDISTPGTSVEDAARNALDVAFPERATRETESWVAVIQGVQTDAAYGPFVSAHDATTWAGRDSRAQGVPLRVLRVIPPA